MWVLGGKRGMGEVQEESGRWLEGRQRRGRLVSRLKRSISTSLFLSPTPHLRLLNLPKSLRSIEEEFPVSSESRKSKAKSNSLLDDASPFSPPCPSRPSELALSLSKLGSNH